MTELAAVYTRVSTREQVVGKNRKASKQEREENRKASLRLQKETCEAYAKAKEWGVFKLYEDAGISGAKEQRPALQEMMADAKAGRFQHVIFKKIDRFGRNTRHVLELCDRLEGYGVSVSSVEEGFDSSTPVGRVLRNMLASFAEFERETIRQRMIEGKNAAAEEGKWTGGTLPYGYDYDSEDGLFTINKAEAQIVQKVFDAYPRGRTHKEIADGLNADGISTRQGGCWFPAQVSRILKNTAYLGEGHYNKTNNGVAVAEAQWTPLTFPRIIETKLWKQVRARTKKSTRDSQRPKDAVSPYLLSGLLICGHCQGGMTSRTKRRKDHRLHYYTCTRQYHYETDCLTPKMMRAEKVDDATWLKLTTALSSPEDILTACEVYAEELGAGSPVDDGQVASLRRALAAREQEHERWETMWAQAKITDGKRDKHFASLDREMAEIREHIDRLAEAQAQQVNIEHLRGQVFKLARMMRNGARDFNLEERKALVRALVEKVWLGNDGDIRIECAIKELTESSADGETCAQGDSMAQRHSERSEESQLVTRRPLRTFPAAFAFLERTG